MERCAELAGRRGGAAGWKGAPSWRAEMDGCRCSSKLATRPPEAGLVAIGRRHDQSFTRLNLSALAITVTELKLMAALAIMGESTSPVKGKSTPAASGTPAAL